MRVALDIIAQTFRTLWAHKLRSFLTMFGIAWGVGSLLLLVGLGEGFRSGQRREMRSMGEDIEFMYPGRAPAVAGNMSSSRPYKLTIEDADDVAKAPYVRAASPVLIREDIREVSQFGSTNGQVTGVLPVFNTIRYLPLDRGRWINDLDESQRRDLVVIGDEMVKNLFPDQQNPIGSSILLNGRSFEVIGVVQRVGKGDNNSTNNRAFVPFSAMHTYFPLKQQEEENAISFINFRPETREQHALAMTEARKVIARNHNFDAGNDDAFEAWDSVKTAEMVGKIFDAMNYFLGSVGLITLALGAIGIINIMLVAVSERTREIGLRKALGATNRSVLAQFFLEGTFLTLFSGGVGLTLAIGFCSMLAKLPAPPGFDTPRVVPMSAAVAIGTLALAGIVAGLYPARKAALMAPVDALRQE
ncbi:MAG TPA: ABC transporter permease [Candidatus Koribacter sp.]|jgi:putative ABC transport system permease protein